MDAFRTFSQLGANYSTGYFEYQANYCNSYSFLVVLFRAKLVKQLRLTKFCKEKEANVTAHIDFLPV